MKKIVALVLALALTLGCCAALAEAPAKTEIGSVDMAGAFKLQCTLPDTYEISIVQKDNESLVADIVSSDENKLSLSLVIEFEEAFYDVKRLDDLSEEILQAIIETFPNYEEADISYTETSHGTKLLMVKGYDDPISYVSFWTVYEGYEVEVFAYDDIEGGERLSDELIKTIIDFLSDMDFIPEDK